MLCIVQNVPEEIMSNISGQLRQVMPVPKKITDYTPQEIAAFPKLFDWYERDATDVVNIDE